MTKVSGILGTIGPGETAVSVEVVPERDEPDQPRRAGEKGAYPSEVEAWNLVSRDSIGRERGKGRRRGKHGPGGRGTSEVGGGSVVAGGDGSSGKVTEGSAPVRGWYRCCKQGYIRANCRRNCATASTDEGTLPMSALRRRKRLCRRDGGSWS